MSCGGIPSLGERPLDGHKTSVDLRPQDVFHPLRRDLFTCQGQARDALLLCLREPDELASNLTAHVTRQNAVEQWRG